jgi:DNA (cytosine-5)-methyltransferase 1
MADADGAAGNGTRPAGEALPRPGEVERLGRRSGGVGREGLAQSGLGVLANGLPTGLGGHWDREPDVGRVAVNVPQRVDKLRALGNALVPQIAEWIGRQIVEWEGVTA